MSSALRIIFAGTPEFSVPPLRALLGSGHQVVAVYTQPDRPAGRGRKLTASPVKEVALEHGIPVMQPVNFRSEEAKAELEALQADLMVVVAYGLILPQRVLDAPRLGCVNIHASLLPRWRGAAPIQRAILAGDTETGITIMQMEAGLDTGPMLLEQRCAIAEADNGGALHDRLSVMGAEALMAALPGIIDGSLMARKQDDALANYASKLEKAEANIDWSRSAAEIHRKIRAFNPWPVAQTTWKGEVLRLWEASVLERPPSAAPGTVVAEAREGIDIAAADRLLRIHTLQLPGKRPVSVQDFLNSHSMLGATLG